MPGTTTCTRRRSRSRRRTSPAHLAEEFDRLGQVYDPFTSYRTHRARYRLASALRDVLGPVLGRRRVLRALFGLQVRMFRPAHTSTATMEPIDRTPATALRIGTTTWPGWSLGDDDVQVLPAGAHAPGDLLVHVPEHRLLCAGDITFPLFPTFADSSRDRILDVLDACAAMARQGTITRLADGHSAHCFQGRAEVTELIDRRIGDHLDFEHLLQEILTTGDGLTPGEIYEAVQRTRDRPVVQRYLDLEFPHSPPSLQNVIVHTLWQLGYEAHGRAGRQRFG